MPNMQVTVTPTQVPGLTAGQRYVFVNQEGQLVRLHEGTDAPSVDSREYYPLAARSIDRVSSAVVRLEAGNNLYAWVPSGTSHIYWSEEP